MAGPDTTDPFEIALRDWSAQERIIQSARSITRAHALDQEIVEAIEDAYRRQDRDDLDRAIAALFEAVAEDQREEDDPDDD